MEKYITKDTGIRASRVIGGRPFIFKFEDAVKENKHIATKSCHLKKSAPKDKSNATRQVLQ
jgi:hypothetical protein